MAERQYRSLFAYATNFTDDRELIKDAIQEVFTRIWEKRTIISIQFVAIYLIKSLRNELLQTLRRTKQPFASLQSQEVGQLSDGQTVETQIEQGEANLESHDRLRRAIDHLPKRQQEALFLKFYQGFDNDQIAALMNINRQSVANLLYKALGTLKSQIAFFRYWFIALVVCL